MIKISLLISIIIHCIVLMIIFINIDSVFSPKINDTDHAVFDFVKVGDKSKAPILSNENGKLGKNKSTKSFNDRKRIYTSIKQKQPDENTNNIKESINFMEEKNNIERNKDVKEKKKDNSKPQKKNEKSISKKDNKKIQKEKNEQSNKKVNPLQNRTNKDINKKDVNKITNKNVADKNGNKNNLKQNKNNTKKLYNKALINLQENKNTTGIKSAKKSFDSLLNDVSAVSDNENNGMNAEEVGDTLTATQIDLIRQTIRKCWHFPAGLKDAEDLVVDIKMELDQDGNVKTAEVINSDRMRTDSNFRTAAENAYRAVLDPKCNPLPLPKDKYEEWKELELSFNPKDMFN